MSDRRLLQQDLSVFRNVMKPSELEASPAALPDGSSENVRFVPIPIERDSAAEQPTVGPMTAAAGGCAARDDGLTPQQRLAIGTLLCGSTLAACAARLGVSVRTLYKWRHQPAFAAQLNVRSAEALEANCVRARNLMLKSTQVLAESLRSREATRWAARIVQMGRVWQMAQTLPTLPDPSAAGDAPVTASDPEAAAARRPM